MLDRTTINVGWYIALTEPSCETKAKVGILRYGFLCNLPTFTKSIWAGRSKRRLVKRPLFPGYIFVGFNFGNERWDLVRDVSGVREFLRVNGRPASIPQAAINVIDAKVDELALPPKQRSTYRKGQDVRVIDGPYSGFLGPIERLNGKGRVSVMLDMFCRKVPVEVHESEIAVVA
jgi:transcription antitermination factor NusG